MSFFRSPQLFLGYSSTFKSIRMLAIYVKFGTPVDSGEVDSIGPVHFTHHLSLGDNKISDFDYFFDYLTISRNNDMFVNCQGLVLRYSRYADIASNYYTWSPRTLDTSIFGLPAYEDPRVKEKELATKLDACIEEGNREKAEKQALETVIRALETENSTLKDEKCFLQQTISGLKGEVERVKNEKNALIIDLDGKNTEILTLYKQAILVLQAKSSTLEGEIQRAKNENDLCNEDTRKAKEIGLQAPKTELGSV